MQADAVQIAAIAETRMLVHAELGPLAWRRRNRLSWAVRSRYGWFMLETSRAMVPVAQVRNPFAGQRYWSVRAGKLMLSWS